MKNVISEWKSQCHFSLQTEKFGFPNLLLYKTIRANSFKNLKSPHKHIIFFPPETHFLTQSIVQKKKEKTKNRALGLLPSTTLTPLPPRCLSTLHHAPICILWCCAGYVSPEHTHRSMGIPTTSSWADYCVSTGYWHTAPRVKRLHPRSGEEKLPYDMQGVHK